MSDYPPPYPPQQEPAYPPAQQAYPPPQQYPPQQQAYPPQQQAYPPQQQAYPPQQGYDKPPPAYGGQPQPQTTTSTNVVVVQQQPAVVHTVVHRRYGTNDHGLLFAIIATCTVFWCAGWVGLFCTIPAIFVAINAQNNEASGNLEAMRQNHNLSLILSVVGLVTGFGALILWIILGSVGA